MSKCKHAFDFKGQCVKCGETQKPIRVIEAGITPKGEK